ncbi:orotate phosphoribosyltransferase [Microthyrium microscopicum]|uniref:Orotate phosphoribosyltransferase n=1 Tax=Microthyrium microscopicum TaxID=703497 RepID=A0A6A6UM54_9PEZI|nr:orotate phosphoribosyltransferase [Microthyrium microscopicum]
MATSNLPPHRASFLQTCIEADALKFGTFTLKSGRISPYFFNAGLFNRADLVRSISYAFAHTLALQTPQVDFDILFGPAYKGIPLCATTIDKLAAIDPKRFDKVSYSFNRKEAKTHGEGGNIVGAPLKGKRVVIIDDVITAGTAIREAIEIIKAEGGELVGIVVAFDRLEKTPMFGPDGQQIKGDVDDGKPRPSAIGEVTKEHGVPVFSILTLDDVVEYFKGTGSQEDLKRLEEYREKYKATN